MRAMLQVTGPCEIGKMWGTEIAPHPIQADHLAPTHLNVQTQRRAPPKKNVSATPSFNVPMKSNCMSNTIKQLRRSDIIIRPSYLYWLKKQNNEKWAPHS